MREILPVVAIIAAALAVAAGIGAAISRSRWRRVNSGFAALCLVAAAGSLITLAAPFSPATSHVPTPTPATPPPGRPAPVSATTAVYVVGWACPDASAAPQGCDQGQSLVALSGRDGTVRWKVPAPSQRRGFASGPLLYDGVLYTYSQVDDMGHGELAAVSASNGKTLWHVPFPYYVELMEGMGNSLNVFTTNPDHQNLTFGWMVVTVNVQDGSTQRTVLLPTEVENNNFFALDENVFYTCDAGRNVKAIQVSDGTLLWQSVYGKSATSADPCTVAASAGVVYVSQAHGGTLFALRAADGTLLWQMHGSSLHEVVTVANGVAYMIQPGVVTSGPCNPECPTTSATPDTLLAIRTQDGKILWQRQFANGSIRGGTLAGETLYLGGGALTAVRTSDGKMLWQVTHTDRSYQVNVALPGAVYVEMFGPDVVFHNGTAYEVPMAINTADGSPFWQGAVWLDGDNEMAVGQ